MPRLTFAAVLFAWLLSTAAARADEATQPSCADLCSSARSNCLALFDKSTLRISSPYLLENLTPAELSGIKSSKFMTSGKAAVEDSFSEWDVSTDPETGRTLLKPQNPVLTGTVTVVPARQKKRCEKKYATCMDRCG